MDVFIPLLALAGGVGLILYFVYLALHALIKRAVKEALREYEAEKASAAAAGHAAGQPETERE